MAYLRELTIVGAVLLAVFFRSDNFHAQKSGFFGAETHKNVLYNGNDAQHCSLPRFDASEMTGIDSNLIDERLNAFGGPVLITGAIRHWMALQKWHDQDYFLKKFGGVRVPYSMLVDPDKALNIAQASHASLSRHFLPRGMLTSAIPSKLQQGVYASQLNNGETTLGEFMAYLWGKKKGKYSYCGKETCANMLFTMTQFMDKWFWQILQDLTVDLAGSDEKPCDNEEPDCFISKHRSLHC